MIFCPTFQKNAPIDRASAPSPCEETPTGIATDQGQEGAEMTTEKGEKSL